MKSLGRIDELDLLRGFFILVIIVDHLQRWPSPFTYITGEGRLWVSAAEGFFIISGLLIGYLRGYKQKDIPIKTVTKKLAKRAGLLYIWTILITLFVVAMTPLFPHAVDLLPRVADVDQTQNLGTYLLNVFTLSFASDWIYFLRLYAIMLLAAPIFIWLLRKGHWAIALMTSIAIYGASFLFETPEGAMQWQILFFVPAIVGYYLPQLVHRLQERPQLTKSLMYGFIGVTLITMVLSYFWVLGWNYVEAPDSSFSRETYVATRSWLDPWFAKAPLAVGRVLLAFVWFIGMFGIFHLLRTYITKWLGWLLFTFGRASLSAYCLQAILLVFIQAYIPLSTSRFTNTIVTIGGVMLIWGLLRVPFIARVLPR